MQAIFTPPHLELRDFAGAATATAVTRSRFAGTPADMADLDRPLPIHKGSQRKGAASFGDIAHEAHHGSMLDAEGPVDAHPTGAYGCMLHVAEQLYGNGCALLLCALLLALGITSFTIGAFALAMNQFFLGRMLDAEQPVERATVVAPRLTRPWPPGAGSPGSWLRRALGMGRCAAHSPTRAASRP